MSSRIHHPSCPARTAPAPLSHVDELWTDARCICPPPPRRGRPVLGILVDGTNDAPPPPSIPLEVVVPIKRTFWQWISRRPRQHQRRRYTA